MTRMALLEVAADAGLESELESESEKTDVEDRVDVEDRSPRQ